MEKISVIVPVYNREKTIRKCLYSLVNQTYQNIEILVINDGSTDDSKEIIDEFYKKYPDKIVAIHTENQGVSMARNEGLKRVSGDLRCMKNCIIKLLVVILIWSLVIR